MKTIKILKNEAGLGILIMMLHLVASQIKLT